ncbi:unnamed protein product [Ostreobium quekettii]|uniref:DUF6815 domain-containing protein n=1 Tax=Ostreobium quekettii TaxID=121088 RepID=A0A8S1J0Y7_9CHLO|nr:unnamed protein product [Ostreobium quekettii]
MTFCEQYLEGNGCGLVDQRFLPRVTEGELSVSIVHDKPVEIVHKKPVDGGVSATVGAGASCVSYPPDDAQFAPLMHAFVSEDLPRIMPALGMDGEPLPLVWEAEFILGDKQDDGTDAYFLGELNCSCVGVTNQRHVADAMSQAAIDAVSKQ